MVFEPVLLPVPLFTREVADTCAAVRLRFEDRELTAPQGTNLAAALLLGGVGPFRTTPVSAAPRAPYCMMGVCFDCLVEVDGVPSRQACQVVVHEGMRVRAQQGASALPANHRGAPHAD